MFGRLAASVGEHRAEARSIIAEDGHYGQVLLSRWPFLAEPEIADVGLAEAEAFVTGRKIRVTKVPFSAVAKALINDQPQGFVKILSDPATGVVLGGSIVGRHAAELISVIALAVTTNLKVSDIVESLLVHPTLSEALADAAE